MLELSLRGILPFAGRVVLFAPEGSQAVRRCLELAKDVVILAPGGDSRHASVASGLEYVDSEFVFTHDAARPLIHAEDIRSVLEVALRSDAAILASPVTDTIKRRFESGQTMETVPRHDLWAAQTPQAFRSQLLRSALARDLRGTDDASFVEALGQPVSLVEARHLNPKLTTASDLRLIRALLREQADLV
jgi:2-C-methyl-D-erythritol 4-phosphate cytidylyltransferase